MRSETQETDAAEPPRGRLSVLDVARGCALLAMAAYHTVWDLGYLHLTPENHGLSSLGKAAAHGIAGTFLILVGIGLVLMNRPRILWRAFLLRLGRIGGAALAITAATWFAFPDSYIFFGILHCIALSSVLALPFLALPVGVTGLVAILVIAAPHFLAADLFDAPALFFLGLGREIPRTNDYVPLFPWFGLVLLGVVVARLSREAVFRSALSRWVPTGRAGRVAAMAGRHSLAVYLVHQPVLLALLTGLVTLIGPHPRAGMTEFRHAYRQNCTRTGGEAAACRIAARCVVEALRREGLWAEAERSFTAVERAKAQGLSQDCYDASDKPPL